MAKILKISCTKCFLIKRILIHYLEKGAYPLNSGLREVQSCSFIALYRYIYFVIWYSPIHFVICFRKKRSPKVLSFLWNTLKSDMEKHLDFEYISRQCFVVEYQVKVITPFKNRTEDPLIACKEIMFCIFFLFKKMYVREN